MYKNDLTQTLNHSVISFLQRIFTNISQLLSVLYSLDYLDLLEDFYAQPLAPLLVRLQRFWNMVMKFDVPLFPGSSCFWCAPQYVFLCPIVSPQYLEMSKPAMEAGFSRAEEEIRTPTPVTALPPQSSASTNFATSAYCLGCKNNVSDTSFNKGQKDFFQVENQSLAIELVRDTRSV